MNDFDIRYFVWYFQSEISLSSSTECLKYQIRQEISALRNKLNIKEKALCALVWCLYWSMSPLPNISFKIHDKKSSDINLPQFSINCGNWPLHNWYQKWLALTTSIEPDLLAHLCRLIRHITAGWTISNSHLHFPKIDYEQLKNER